jgi:hypothetical protein
MDGGCFRSVKKNEKYYENDNDELSAVSVIAERGAANAGDVGAAFF